jgi:hypothetical protein
LSVLNAHYDRDCGFVNGNYGKNIVVGYDETGFDGAADLAYRRQGWNFIMCGGGLYDNLDWSFSVAHPDGGETNWDKGLGGGSPDIRKQLGIMLSFVDGFDLPNLKPDNGFVKSGVPSKANALVEAGNQYAVYLDGGSKADLVVELPAAEYEAEWVNTKTGAIDKTEKFEHKGGNKTLSSPSYTDDIALRIVKSIPVSAGTDTKIPKGVTHCDTRSPSANAKCATFDFLGREVPRDVRYTFPHRACIVPCKK